MSKTYVKTLGKDGKFRRGVTLGTLPGVVWEHPFDSVRGGGYGRKHETSDPERLAREICEDLEADGWTPGEVFDADR